MYHMSSTPIEKHALPKDNVKRFGLGAYAITCVALIIANIYVYRAIYARPVLEISVFTAGKGVATLVVTARHKTLLIDTGSDASVVREIGTALPMWQRELSAIILTSSDMKSAGGLPEVTSRYRSPIPTLFGTDVPYGTPYVFDDDIRVSVIAPQMFTISYGSASLTVSSSTARGTYRADGTSIRQ